VSVESAELLDLYLFGREPKREEVCDEIADVMIYLMLLADQYAIDIDAAVANKIRKNERKYPVSKCRGSNAKSKL
jgi:NTP pyrophosphatase (non-canonical NTP hydrolase)